NRGCNKGRARIRRASACGLRADFRRPGGHEYSSGKSGDGLGLPERLRSARNLELLERVGKVSRSVGCEEADGIREPQRRWAGRGVLCGRQVDSLNHVKSAAVEEQVRHQAATIRTLRSRDVLEPGANGIGGLTELIGHVVFSAIDRQEAPIDRRTAGFD